jgi:hypothetical protein
MTNLAASVRTRLLNKAKVAQQDFSLVLRRYGQIKTMENFHKISHGGLTPQLNRPPTDASRGRYDVSATWRRLSGVKFVSSRNALHCKNQFWSIHVGHDLNKPFQIAFHLHRHLDHQPVPQKS